MLHLQKFACLKGQQGILIAGSLDRRKARLVSRLADLLELLSSVLQLVWFRLTKKLLLRMAPLHEAMRCAGWSPLRITATFGGAAGVCMLLAMLFVRLS